MTVETEKGFSARFALIKQTEKEKEEKINRIKNMSDSEIYFFSKRYINDFFNNKESEYFNNIFIDLIELEANNSVFSRFLVKVFDNSKLLYERKFNLINMSINEGCNR